MVEVFALEQQAQPELLGQPLALGQRRRPPGVVAEQVVELAPEGRVGPGLAERPLELDAGRHERLGDEPTAELTEAAVARGLAHEAAGGVAC